MQNHKNEIASLETVHDLSRLEDPEIVKYLKNKFLVKMSRHSYTLLKYQIDFNQLNLIMHIMNLNIHFQISSEPDLVLDGRSQESILLGDETSLLVSSGQNKEGNILQDLPPLTLGILKEFYLDLYEMQQQ